MSNTGIGIAKQAESISYSKIRSIFNLAQGMEDVVNFGIGEPDYDTPKFISEQAKAGIDSGFTHYTANAGLSELRSLVSEKLSTSNAIYADPRDEVIITCGAMGGLYLALRVLLDPGDEVLLPQPSWVNYESHIALCGGRVVPVPLRREEGFSLTAEMLQRCVTPETKGVLLNSPSNPTGKVIPEGELQKIASLARKYNLFILSDEVYEHFIWKGARHISIASFPDARDRTLTVNSFSKSYAMTGWRVGYSCGPKQVIANMIKLQENIYACASSVGQVAAMAALKDGEISLRTMIAEYDARRALMEESLSSMPGIEIVESEGSFYLFVYIGNYSGSSEEFAKDLLKTKKLAVIPGSAFGDTGEGFVRISYANNREQLKEGLRRLRDYLSEKKER